MPFIDALSGPDLLYSIINGGLATHAGMSALARRERHLEFLGDDAVRLYLYIHSEY